MTQHDTPTTLSAAPEQGLVRQFLRDETGGPLLEYVTLLISMFIMFSWLVQPVPTSAENLPALQEALMQFCRDAFEHLTQP